MIGPELVSTEACIGPYLFVKQSYCARESPEASEERAQTSRR